MKLVAFRYFDGPNVHALRPMAEAVVDLQEWAEVRSDRRPGFMERLLGALPGLADHSCSLGRPGGFCERLREGTYPGHIVEHVALELLALTGETGRYGKTREAGGTRVMIAFEAETRRTGQRALEESLAGVERLLRGDPWLVAAHLPAWRQEWAGYRWGPSTVAIVQAARARDIPVVRLDEGSLVQLGYGVCRTVLRATLTGRTSAVAVDRAGDKQATKEALAAAGIPVPPGIVARSLAEAEAWWRSVEVPVVVKPRRGCQGRGVTVGVNTVRALAHAYREAARVDTEVVVEASLPGRSYRFLVVGSRLVAAAERRPPIVVGDGLRSVRELVAALNADPRRGPDHNTPLTWVPLDPVTLGDLAGQGLTLESVPQAGQRVELRRAANLSTGADARDVTDEVAPALAAQVVRAARAIGLDVAGVDVVAPAVDRPLHESGGAVVEVNAAPGIRMHEAPSEGRPRAAGAAIVDYLFPPGATGRIPLVAVTGTNGKTTVTRMVGHILRTHGFRVGMTTTDGIVIDDEEVAQGDLTGPWSARLILSDPTVEAAVLETARGGIMRGGLGFDALDVGIVTNIGVDHLGQDGIRDLDDLARIKSLIVDVVRPDGTAVLNADDPRVLGMASRCRGRVMLFSTSPDNLAVRKCLAEGGQAVVVRRGQLVWQNGRDTRIVPVRALPATLRGVFSVNVQNAAAAAAAALALNIPPKTVAAALLSFPAGGQGSNRGRLEVTAGAGVTVVIDYAHNAPAVEAVGRMCRALKRRPIVTVLGLPGDRRDEDLAATARAVGAFSQTVVIREDQDRRGRAPGEVPGILERALRETGFGAERLAVVLDEAEAVTRAILDAPAGALVLVLYERYAVVRSAVDAALKSREQTAAETGIGQPVG